jgi:N-acetyl-gamma-glutamyl-phosphate reductase
MKIFIDGQAGTTGLQLEWRLHKRSDVQLLEIDPALRKDRKAKQALMNEAEVIFLCLPDDEARISAEMAPRDTLVIDASTAHRTALGWAYGLPELSAGHRRAIAEGRRIAVPGCHACGFNALIYPLVACGILSADAQVNCTSLTGYSGGGKSLIGTYETDRVPGDPLHAPRPYALGLSHKHLPEMKAVSGLNSPPHFYPVVGDMAQGMLVSIHLWANQFSKAVTPGLIHGILKQHYQGQGHTHGAGFIEVKEADDGFMDPTACNGSNRMELFVFGHEKQVLLAARLDNLGKGASGAAV